MNKTVTINISGIIFHIEEDAYDRLSKYLSTIKGYFSKTDGGNEIMSDIEARIAELLQGKINAGKQVILLADVEYVMNVMGRPEDFGAEAKQEENNNSEEQEPVYQERIKRRLFRNPDEKALGGVCSGLAAYFGIDTVWVRLAMFLLIFFGGLSIWVYIVLWIVIPEAKTTADKLAMRGEQANINSIFKTFQEEAEDLKNRYAKNGKKQFNDVNQTVRDNFGYARGTAASVLNAIFNVIGRLIGLFLIFIGGILLFAYIMSLLGISVLDSSNYISNWRHVIFESTSDYVLAVIAFIIVAGIPVIMLIYGGVKLLFKIRYSNRWLNLSLGIIWTIGLILGFYIAALTIRQFSQTSRIKETSMVHITGDTLVVKMDPRAKDLKLITFENNDDLEISMTNNHGDYVFGEKDGKRSIIGYAELNVVESNSDSIELIVTRSSHGHTKKEANENAKAVSYSLKQVGNELVFDEIFLVNEDSKFRAQDVDIKIRLPKGKVIYFDKSVKHMLDDIDNTTNTWDGDMIERRWIMTEHGLKCIDCDGLEDLSNGDDDRYGEDHSESGKNRVKISGKGIEVNDDETEINIDEDGIKIKTPEKNVEIESKNKKSKKETDNKDDKKY